MLSRNNLTCYVPRYGMQGQRVVIIPFKTYFYCSFKSSTIKYINFIFKPMSILTKFGLLLYSHTHTQNTFRISNINVSTIIGTRQPIALAGLN